jgi:hypothetical protein
MYYPKSQITTNLYTNGEELFYLNGLPYIGYYYKLSNGSFFSGKTPQDKPNFRLILNPSLSVSSQYIEDDKVIQYIESTNMEPGYPLSKNQIISIPYYSPIIPTENDYQTGECRRYFCKKVNEIIYIEINKNTYDKLKAKDKEIAWDQYLYFNIPWQLTGDKEKVYKVNKNIVELTIKNQKLPMFNKYLKEDYIKYYK